MGIEKYFKKGLRIGKLGLITGLSAFLFNCESILGPKDNYEDYDIRYVQETIVEENLERPSGLSIYEVPAKNLQKSTESEAVNINSVFTTGPKYTTKDSTQLYFYQNPKIYQISGTLEEILGGSANINVLTEFSGEYSRDFDTRIFNGVIIDTTGDGVNDIPGILRPIGLDIETERLDNGNILVSSNVSNKLFLVDTLGKITEYMQDDKLYGITDMELASDGKIYAIQQPLAIIDSVVNETVYYNRILREKRGISIDSLGAINQEFTIPNILGQGVGRGAVLLDEQLSLVENSPIGKTRFGYDFYVSDLLANKIYGVKDGVSEVLVDNVRYPSSVRVGLLGNLFYTTSPLRIPPELQNGDLEIDYPTELHWYRPKTGDDYLIHSFNEKYFGLEGYSAQAMQVQYNGQTYELPTGFNVSTVLSETDTKLRFLLTRSCQGDLWGVEATKQ